MTVVFTFGVGVTFGTGACFIIWGFGKATGVGVTVVFTFVVWYSVNAPVSNVGVDSKLVKSNPKFPKSKFVAVVSVAKGVVVSTTGEVVNSGVAAVAVAVKSYWAVSKFSVARGVVSSTIGEVVNSGVVVVVVAVKSYWVVS